MNTSNANSEEGESSEPESASATTIDAVSNGADSHVLGEASDTEGSAKSVPASTDTTRKTPPYDPKTAADSIIAELDGVKSDEDDDAEEPEAKDDDKTETETPPKDESKAEEKPEASEVQTDEKTAEPDADEPTEETINRYSKGARKQIKRAWEKVRKLSEPARFGDSVSQFVTSKNIDPNTFRDGLMLISDVVNAKDPQAAFDRLMDEAVSLVEDKNPDQMTPREKATVLRRMAERLAPEEKPVVETKAEEVKLPERLQDLVDTGELSLKAARAAHAAENPAKKETPPPAAERQAPKQMERETADIAHNGLVAREARGRAEVQKVQTELAATYKETWAQIMPVVKDALAGYRGAPPELWPKIVRDQAKIAAKQFEQAVKKPGRMLTPSRGKATVDTRDDLQKIIDAD